MILLDVSLYVLLDDDIVITVNTSLLEVSGSWVNVSWSGVKDSDKHDWIGVYSPPVNSSIDPASHAPVKYQVAEVFIKCTQPESVDTLLIRLQEQYKQNCQLFSKLS